MSENKYWLSLDVSGLDPLWQEVTKEQWVRAERAAGFRGGREDEPATGGFSGGGVRGSLSATKPTKPTEDPLKGTAMAKDPWDRTHRSTVPDGYNDYY